jgi:hypothetical protein
VPVEHYGRFQLGSRIGIVAQADILFVLILFVVLDSRLADVERPILMFLFSVPESSLHCNKLLCLKGIPNDVSVLTEMFPFDYMMLACDGMITNGTEVELI